METPRYRIGNDITVFWAILNRDGSPYNLDGKKVELYVFNDRGREKVDIEISSLDGEVNNVLRWDFKSNAQKVLGAYTLTCSILTSDGHREIKKDRCKAFELVPRSELEDEHGDVNLDGGDLILSSKLDVYRLDDIIKNLKWSKIVSTPTTIEGYGITDAYTKIEIDTKVAAINEKIDGLSGSGAISILVNGATYAPGDLGVIDLSTAFNNVSVDLSAYATLSALEAGLAGKQDTISDLASIRSGAAAGATALQSVPDEYITESELTAKGYATTAYVDDADTAIKSRLAVLESRLAVLESYWTLGNDGILRTSYPVLSTGYVAGATATASQLII